MRPARSYDRGVDLYGQDAEASLLAAFVPALDSPTMVDVGAERGSLAAMLLAAGIEGVHAIEPHPDNARELRVRFAEDFRVRVHELALGASQQDVLLHVSEHPDGSAIPFGHTLLERDDTSEIQWRSAIPVAQSTLAALIEAGELPSRVGILKIDSEGNDLAVLEGIGALEAEVVMVEHWVELPQGLGACPWTADDLFEALRPRGFEHFAFVLHSGEFTTLRWDDPSAERGEVGNLVFLHERALVRLMPALLECASALAGESLEVAGRYVRAAEERLRLVDELHVAATSLRASLEQVSAAAEQRARELSEARLQVERLEQELAALRSATC
jgi:FkbM family methyltransferase